MSTSAGTTIDTSRPTVPLTRHVAVEWRKLSDTRAGLWLLLITGGLLLLALVLTLLVLGLNDDVTITASGFSQVMTVPLSILLPVFAILTITSEWGQRTHLVTFTLEPKRSRIMLAKFIAVTLLALATIAVAALFGAVGNVLYGVITGNDVVWNLGGSEMVWTVIVQLAYFWMAYALASLLLSTPGAVAVFYVVALILPMVVYPILTVLFEWARDFLPWIDLNYAAAPLSSGVDFTGEDVKVGVLDYVRFIAAAGIWIVVPGTLGWLRVLRSEVK